MGNEGKTIGTSKILLYIVSDNIRYMARKRSEQGFRLGSVRRLKCFHAVVDHVTWI
jgi:hypothetical protein